MTRLGAIIGLLLLSACGSAPPPPPVVIDVAPDVAVHDACERARVKGCSWGGPTGDGESCEEFFADVLASPSSGVTLRYVACLSRIDDCAGERRCAR